MGLFVREEGYTSVAVAVALLVSVALVFSVATVEWVGTRSADVQAVADAAALAGSNTVAAYYTVAQVADACVLSLGMAGMAVLGAGLICAAVPGMRTQAARVLDMGKKILKGRARFAKKAATGLRALERALPYVGMVNAASCIAANGGDTLRYSGCAMLLPLDSESDFSMLEDEVDGGDVGKAAARIGEATERVEDAKRKADEALERAWRADCVDEPSCLSSRAASLGRLPAASNPKASSPESWSFAMPIRRSRAYYAARLANEAPEAEDIESLTDSLAREAFYEYALGEVRGAWAKTLPDGTVSLHVPHLARNTREMRATWLYTDARWPTSMQDGGPVLHSTLACPAATGEAAGLASVAELEAGDVGKCAVCGMDAVDLGSVAAISTTATNGYEHYWQIVVEAASAYEQAREEQADAERKAKKAAEEGKDAFERALEQLRGPRLVVFPPGRDGCVSVTFRKGGTLAPPELTRTFAGDVSLPPGAAVSAARLVRDEAADGNDVLSRFLDGVSHNVSDPDAGPLHGVFRLWGRMLVGYARMFDDVERSADELYGEVDGPFGSGLGSWLRRRLGKALGMAGLEPADMRLHKPVLASTGEVMCASGIDPGGKVRALVSSLPSGGTAQEYAHALGVEVAEYAARRVVLADFAIPGTETVLPLVVDLAGAGV